MSSFSNSRCNDTLLIRVPSFAKSSKNGINKKDNKSTFKSNQNSTYPDEFLPPVLGLVFTALLKSSPAAEAVHPPSPDAAVSDTGAEEAVGFAQSGSPYCPLMF